MVFGGLRQLLHSYIIMVFAVNPWNACLMVRIAKGFCSRVLNGTEHNGQEQNISERNGELNGTEWNGTERI